ncbi:Pericentrin-AKAP-450 domain of centrosomal targeting protein-domain-containing protein [Annulohypoxylon maeteangense]|uniref:Pericentrin-AKAP-450 domain of centrosomal targeting protein-domain-containing protein n=1 Tax=Annulohypoxylon maeteangense TaxID=1927788 RepID=UPI0020076CCF|nr:Pericentrin-AKAP-450 domain of centrosomal targeting protein-domain-containing protein [Annulohypoxylon maeteangense]KAI0880944.1 Pericentrin-AKAP-450 domain of centrosomal targeting protein-domain-containing protein [Annulohypoxylon maeteangense]
MDVVDQRDHEAVIRAADTAEKRHTKEIRGMALQMQWMQARWEREASLRNDAAFAKKFLSLQLEIADACNKADLRILKGIHKQLGIKSPDSLLSSRKRGVSKKPPNNLKIFANVLRAVARMRISARNWGEQEKTRKKLVNAWEESQKREAELEVPM